MIHHSLSTQSSEKSELKAWVASLGEVPMKDISAEMLQSIITYWSRPGKGKCSGKTTRNRVATFRLLWTSAKLGNYVAHDPFQGLAMPSAKPEDEQPSFTTEDVKRIINAASPPYDVVFWTVAETGIRREKSAPWMSVTWTWRTASSRCASVGGTVRSPARRATNPGYFVCHLNLSNVCDSTWRVGMRTSPFS